jgi:hypothetical protein
VLALVAQGLTNRQIGARLFISEKTASVHVSNILAKLSASGRTEAVAIAAACRNARLATVRSGARRVPRSSGEAARRRRGRHLAAVRSARIATS